MTEIEPAQKLIVIRPPDEQRQVAYTDLDYAITEETAENLIRARPENTRRAYERAWDQFAAWCARSGRVPLPATAQTLAGYTDRLIGVSLAPATIEQAIGTIRAKHREAGHGGQPDTEASLRLLRAYKRTWAGNGNRVRKRTPALLPALRAMAETCDPGKPAGIRDRAILLLGFNMMARRSELAALNLADLRDAGDEGIEVLIRQSKTDQEAEGQSVAVPYGQHAETCAIRAVRAWISVLADTGITEGALLRPVDRHGRIGAVPGAAGRARDRLTGHSVNEIIRSRAQLAKLDSPEGYGGHSLRSGAATTAYAAGVPVSVIAEHGRWSPKSPVMLGYIRAVDKWKNNPMKGIGL